VSQYCGTETGDVKRFEFQGARDMLVVF